MVKHDSNMKNKTIQYA